MVDSRMFLRQYDGVYCWDVRKTSAMLKVEKALAAVRDRPSSAFDALSALSRDPDPVVRGSVGRTLAQKVAEGQWHERKQDVLPLLSEFVSHADPQVRQAVVGALAALGTDALPLMIEAAEHESPAARITAIRAAGRMSDVKDPRVEQVLERGLRNETRSVIDAALDATAARGESAISLTPVLSTLTASKETKLSHNAVGVILLIHPEGQLPADLPRNFEAGLIAHLSVSGNDTLLKRTLAAIRALGNEEALRIFESQLKGNDPLKGLRACHGLGDMGADARSTIPLIEAAKAKWGSSRTFVGGANNALDKIRGAR
jgi:HEAT repeat protein